jgi:HPr kinase/phosphorylase
MVERPARLKTPSMLQQFELQCDSGANAQIGGRKPKQGRVPNKSRDADGGGGNILSADHHVGDAGISATGRQAASLPVGDGPEWMAMQIHASCASRTGDGVLLIGPPGAGKSDLLLRLLARGFDLVADDQVDIEEGVARPLPGLAGLLEVRGLGIVRLPHVCSARLALLVELSRATTRLPAPTRDEAFNLPLVLIDPGAASAPERVALALDCALGRVPQVAGVFAA